MKQKVEIEDLWRLEERINRLSKKLTAVEKILSNIQRDNNQIGINAKEFKRIKKSVDDYYSLASCKYRLRNGRELNVYELLLTILDRIDRE